MKHTTMMAASLALAVSLPAHAAWPDIYADDFGVDRPGPPPAYDMMREVKQTDTAYSDLHDLFVSVWVETREGTDGNSFTAVYGQAFDGMDGTRRGDVAMLSCTDDNQDRKDGSGDAYREGGVAVSVMPGSSTALVAWSGEDHGDPMTFGKYEIMAAHFTVSSEGLSSSALGGDNCFRMSTTGSSGDTLDGVYPQIAAYGTPDGNFDDDYFVVTWEAQQAFGPDYTRIMAAAIDSEATVGFDPANSLHVSTGTRRHQYNPRISIADTVIDDGSVDGSATARLVYNGSYGDVWIRPITLDLETGLLTVAGVEENISVNSAGTPVTGTDTKPDLAWSSERQEWFVVWNNWTAGGLSRVMGRTYPLDGEAGEPVVLMDSSDLDAVFEFLHPHVVWNPVTAGWEVATNLLEADASAPTYSNIDIGHFRIEPDSAGGLAVDGEFAMVTNVDTHDETDLDGGNFVIDQAELVADFRPHMGLAANTRRGRNLVTAVARFTQSEGFGGGPLGDEHAIVGQMTSHRQVDIDAAVTLTGPAEGPYLGDTIDVLIELSVDTANTVGTDIPQAYVAVFGTDNVSYSIVDGCMASDVEIEGALFVCEMPRDATNWGNVTLQAATNMIDDTEGDQVIAIGAVPVIMGNYDPEESFALSEQAVTKEMTFVDEPDQNPDPDPNDSDKGSGGGGALLWLLPLLGLRRRN